MNDPEMCVIALNMLPADTLAFLVQALQGHQDYSNLKMLLDQQITFLSDHSRSQNLRLDLVDDPDRAALNDDNHDNDFKRDLLDPGALIDLTGVDPASQEATLAVMKSQGWRGKVKTGPGTSSQAARPRPATPPRTGAAVAARPQRCGNCGAEHASCDCSKPLLRHDQRACFNCGGIGHAAGLPRA